MVSFFRKARRTIVLLAVGVFLCGTLGLGLAATKRTANGKTSKEVSAKKTNQSSKLRRTASKSKSRSRRGAFRNRLARLRLEPQRVVEIQQALISEGYFDREPTGNYYDYTRTVMRRYQAANGFPETGLPEAKSLMKLGLGSHPLPPELDSRTPARASVEPLQTPVGDTDRDPAVPSTPR